MDEEKDIIRLLPKKKKSITSILFSRFAIMALVILLQIILIFVVVGIFEENTRYMTIINVCFSLALVLYLFNKEMDSSAKLTWLVIVLLFPIPGAVFMWFTQTDVANRDIKLKVAKAIKESKRRLAQDPEIINAPDMISSGTSSLCQYLNKRGCFPCYGNTDVTFFPLGEYKFEAMIEELSKAKSFIFMEYFIIDEGYMWGRILSVLAETAAQGVDVRVMYDGMCEMSSLSADYPKRLEKLGIKSKPFSPITPMLSTYYNYRDHRKILVIDGQVAFNGGVNLADEYINKIERFGHWKDTAVMLKGEAVQSFTLMFLQMWNISNPRASWREVYIPSKPEKAQGYVMPYSDSPLSGEKIGECVYMDILNRAKSYVHIMTPYLILDDELEGALKYAAGRGVDVRIILPGIPDKKLAYSLAKKHYSSLIKDGVKIYEYTPGFCHAKIFVSDDEKAVVGTINLDYRSLYHHFECATYMYNTSCIADIERDYQATLEKCRQVTKETIKNEKLTMKILGSIAKIFAPLM